MIFGLNNRIVLPQDNADNNKKKEVNVVLK